MVDNTYDLEEFAKRIVEEVWDKDVQDLPEYVQSILRKGLETKLTATLRKVPDSELEEQAAEVCTLLKIDLKLESFKSADLGIEAVIEGAEELAAFADEEPYQLRDGQILITGPNARWINLSSKIGTLTNYFVDHEGELSTIIELSNKTGLNTEFPNLYFVKVVFNQSAHYIFIREGKKPRKYGVKRIDPTDPPESKLRKRYGDVIVEYGQIRLKGNNQNSINVLSNRGKILLHCLENPGEMYDGNSIRKMFGPNVIRYYALFNAARFINESSYWKPIGYNFENITGAKRKLSFGVGRR